MSDKVQDLNVRLATRLAECERLMANLLLANEGKTTYSRRGAIEDIAGYFDRFQTPRPEAKP